MCLPCAAHGGWSRTVSAAQDNALKSYDGGEHKMTVNKLDIVTKKEGPPKRTLANTSIIMQRVYCSTRAQSSKVGERKGGGRAAIR